MDIRYQNKLIKSNQPCPCGKSKDAFGIYSDGHGYCFSGKCEKQLWTSKELNLTVINFKEPPTNSEAPVSFQTVPVRGLTKEALEKFHVSTKIVNDQPVCIQFPYPTFKKIRKWDTKSFWIEGDKKTYGLFGKEVFPKGTFKTLIITEGEFDAIAAYQMVGLSAVSVQSASTALKDCQEDYDYISSAERIYLAFDMDEPGQKAAKLVASLFDFDKVFKIEMGRKDPNEYLLNNDVLSFVRSVDNAKKFTPDGVISSYTEVRSSLEEEFNKPFVSFPFQEGQLKLEGLRFGTSILISGLEGIGKTEVLRKLEAHILKETDYNIGIIHLEENKRTSIRNLLSYQMEIPLKRNSIDIPTDVLLENYSKLTKKDNRVFYYSHFGSNDPDSFLNAVRFLVAVCNCKVVFFDHINILVSGLNVDGDERKTLDYISTRLEMLVEELDFCLIMVCHENDDGRPRGSRNISQTAHVHIRLRREMENPSDFERSKLYMSIAKNRPTGPTGPIGFAFYNEGKGVLEDGIDLNEKPFFPEDSTSVN